MQRRRPAGPHRLRHQHLRQQQRGIHRLSADRAQHRRADRARGNVDRDGEIRPDRNAVGGQHHDVDRGRVDLDLLARLEAAALRTGRHGSVVEIRILQALAHDAGGDVPGALAALARAVAGAPEPDSYVRSFLDEGDPMLGLLRHAIAFQADLVDTARLGRIAIGHHVRGHVLDDLGAAADDDR